MYGGDDAVNSFIDGGICFIDQRCRFFVEEVHSVRQGRCGFRL